MVSWLWRSLAGSRTSSGSIGASSDAFVTLPRSWLLSNASPSFSFLGGVRGSKYEDAAATIPQIA